MSEHEFILSVAGCALIVLGYGIRLLHEAFREYMEGRDER